MSVFWAVILKRIDAVSKSLQKETIDLKAAVDLLKSLSDFLTSQRDLFDEPTWWPSAERFLTT